MHYSKALGGRLMTAGVAAATLFAAGCAKKTETKTVAAPADEVKLVAPAERSAHFAAVTGRLELGGSVYGYVDIDGDMLKLADALRNLALQATAQQPMAAAFVPKDLAPFFTDLGLTDVKALGMSSVAAAGGGFRNRVFFYTPDGRRGLLAGLGGPAAPFTVSGLAPADADLVYETELDAPAVYAAIRAVVARAAGEPMASFMDSRLKQADPDTGLTGQDGIASLKGRFSLVLRVDETRTFSPAPGVTLPSFDFLMRSENVGGLIEKMAAKAPGVVRMERADGVVVYSSKTPLPGGLDWQPEIQIAGTTVTVVTRPDFGTGKGGSLADDPTFKAALAGVGETGNGLTYVSPRLVGRVRRVAELNPEMAPEQRAALDYGLSMLPQTGVALVSIRQNLPDGVLFRSQWNSSLKQNLVLANPGVIAGTGLMAAMAIPAFQKVRTASQEKAVINNLRQLEAASDQYFLETGKKTCVYADLVGTGPTHYIRELKPVAGEDYTGMVFRDDEDLSVTLANGRTISHAR